MAKKAFTLAEVLITLAIIGIVAAVTIPSVIANYQQQEFKTGLRKAVSVLNEAIQANITFEGETPYENSNIYEYLTRHMSILSAQKNIIRCKVGEKWDTSGGVHCGGGDNHAQLVNNVFYTTDGMRYEVTTSSRGLHYKFPLYESGIEATTIKKGSWYCGDFGGHIECRNESSTYGYCGSYGLINNHHNTINTPCLIMVDVNGDKKPNYLSAVRTKHDDGSLSSTTNSTMIYKYAQPNEKRVNDLFTIMITEDRAIPYGIVAQRAMYEK